MKKLFFEKSNTKRGYNEKNPGKAGIEFEPASLKQTKTTATKSNMADKKQKEDRNNAR